MSVADDEAVRELIALAVREDLGGGDVTSPLVPRVDEPAAFSLIAREDCVFAGVEVGARVLVAYDEAVEIEWADEARDGAPIEGAPSELAVVRGPLGTVLSAERVFLNFLQRLCGVATVTRAYVDAVSGTPARIYDTRKTPPGWRSLDKYAVRCGGGCNHRGGLHDAVLIKDNHLAGVSSDRLAGTVFEMLNRLGAAHDRPEFIEVEAETLAQVDALLTVVGIDVVLLDNFSLDQLREAVTLRDDRGLRGKVALEASGGVTLQTVRAVAETGVERISVGALTHSVRAIDLSMERVSC